jgi:hypothetical protein
MKIGTGIMPLQATSPLHFLFPIINNTTMAAMSATEFGKCKQLVSQEFLCDNVSSKNKKLLLKQFLCTMLNSNTMAVRNLYLAFRLIAIANKPSEIWCRNTRPFEAEARLNNI